MGETKSAEEPALPAKRKSDLTSQDQESLPLKSRKLKPQDETVQPKGDSFEPEPVHENEQPVANPEEGEDDGDYEDDDEDDDDDHDQEEENGNAAVDRKGKGVLIEEEEDSGEDDDDDDSSDGGNESEGDSDLSDDPLAEVDLDNILPSRTRRRVVQPGVYIAKDGGNNGEGDDSDDSEA